MSDDPYSPSQVVRQMHRLLHLSPSLHKVDNTFNVTSSDYWNPYTRSLLPLPLILLALALLALAVLSIVQCVAAAGAAGAAGAAEAAGAAGAGAGAEGAGSGSAGAGEGGAGEGGTGGAGGAGAAGAGSAGGADGAGAVGAVGADGAGAGGAGAASRGTLAEARPSPSASPPPRSTPAPQPVASAALVAVLGCELALHVFLRVVHVQQSTALPAHGVFLLLSLLQLLLQTVFGDSPTGIMFPVLQGVLKVRHILLKSLHIQRHLLLKVDLRLFLLHAFPR
eukprot:CAMPEP_0173192162 /NCGR_PEP_ID=MMETSP1141-20130122/13273_1 /TAXON_ID=483371 /ORGANISM="non described non described, Strain CCMP2298" /LENGTH=279 /DNA_ID=CAMNT_0014116403 /DNA_START=202 /DNA_END=1039 /DNA_ORIENTATION=-